MDTLGECPASGGGGNGEVPHTTKVITATASQGGIISPNGSVLVVQGANKTFSITANEGYMVSSVLVDGVNQGVVSTYTFTNVQAAHTISAQFTIIPIVSSACGGVSSIIDNRDINNPVYQTVEIGSQCWLKRNLNVGTRVDGNTDQKNNGVLEKYCYGNSTDTNCNATGGLYQWYEAMKYSQVEGAQGICPDGWHVPSDVEFKTLESYLGMNQSQLDASGWRGNNEGDKLKNGGSSNYSALLGGIGFPDGHWDTLNTMESVWTSSLGGQSPWARFLQAGSSLVRRDLNGMQYGFSVRCIKGNGSPTQPAVPTQEIVVSSEPIPNQLSVCDGIVSVLDDRDLSNPVYQTVVIGNQCWLNRNMNIGTMVNGGVNQNNDSNIEKYCYGNSESACNSTGRLYQWDEAMNYEQSEKARGICPVGWHIPTDLEWKILEIGQGMSQAQSDLAQIDDWSDWRGTIEADRLKNAGLCSTRIPCGTSGYNALLSCMRFTDGHWDNLGNAESIWSSSLSGTNPWARYFRGYSSMISRSLIGRLYGLSVRCIKD